LVPVVQKDRDRLGNRYFEFRGGQPTTKRRRPGSRKNKTIPVPLTPADPDPELDSWVKLLGAGATDEGVLDAFLSSEEYFYRTKPPLLFP
jgi:hypothetical protein